MNDRRERIDPGAVPRHVAIVMDGNGRWARQRGLERIEGHRAGIAAIRRTLEACEDLGVEILTLYAFSTENWKRPRSEVRGLMDLLVRYLREEADRLMEHDIRLGILGDPARLPALARREVGRVVERTASNRRGRLNLALNYGGRDEIVRAARAAAGRRALDEEGFARHLDTAGLPDPDLLIRTGGEMRLSNFLLWQAAYAELWFTSVFWPDFDRDQFYQAILDYQRRRRRFGALTAEDA